MFEEENQIWFEYVKSDLPVGQGKRGFEKSKLYLIGNLNEMASKLQKFICRNKLYILFGL